MSEEVNDIQEEIVEDTEISTKDVVDTETPPESPQDEEKQKEGLFAKIGRIIKGEKETDESTSEEYEIPKSFYDAAKEADWTDDDINDFILDEKGKAKFTNEQLEEMKDSLSPASEDSDESDKVLREKEASEPPKAKEESQEEGLEDSQKDETIKELKARVEALEKAKGEDEKGKEQNTLIELASRASQVFDEESKTFEVFGKTEELPTNPRDGSIIPTSPQMKARKEVWGIASALLAQGRPFKEAMEVSLNAYKGKNLKKDVQRDLVKSLKEHEKKLSPKRSSHTPADKKPLDGYEVVDMALKKAGIETR